MHTQCNAEPLQLFQCDWPAGSAIRRRDGVMSQRDRSVRYDSRSSGSHLGSHCCGEGSPHLGRVMTLTINSLIDLEARLGAHNYKPLDVVLVRGEGVWVWDTEGKRYLDCLSAYSALNQGHCHPKILAALEDQAKRLTLTSRAFRNDQLALLYEDLARRKSVV